MADPSNPYDAEQQLQDELAATTDTQARLILAAWATAWAEISADLTDTLATLLADGTRITTATIARSERLASMLAQVADRIDDLADHAGVTITGDLDTVVDRGVDATRRLITPQMGPADRDRWNPAARPTSRALDAIVTRSTEQITSLALPLSDETYAVVQRELVRGIAAGENPRDTAQRMVDRAHDQWNFGAHRAETIARTETLDAYRNAAQAGEKPHVKVLAGWVWLAHLGPRTCRSCLAMHGTIHDLDETGPKDHQQGRCARGPLVTPRGGGDPDTSWVPSADDHFVSLDRADQETILGVAGYRAWAAGEWFRSGWTKTRKTTGWRDSQVPAPAPKAASPARGRTAAAVPLS